VLLALIVIMEKDNREEFQHDWYAILGCDIGSAIELIQKAARKLAIKYHPDKTTDPTAPEKFLLIQKAKDILSDESKKKVIDEHFSSLRRREEYEEKRNREMDMRRKRYRDDLENKVTQEKSKKRPPPSHEDILAHELNKHSSVLNDMRRNNADVIERAREDARRKIEKKFDDYVAMKEKLTKELGGGLQSCIKVKWRRTEQKTSDELFDLFIECGMIEDIVINEKKGTSALIYFTSESAGRQAVDKYATSNEYRVSFYYTEDHPQTTASTSQHPSHQSSSFNNPVYSQLTNNTAINQQLSEQLQQSKQDNERQTIRNIFRNPFIPLNSMKNHNSFQTKNYLTLSEKEKDILGRMMMASTGTSQIEMDV
jgi:curved DNA-binding protein CbpA